MTAADRVTTELALVACLATAPREPQAARIAARLLRAIAAAPRAQRAGYAQQVMGGLVGDHLAGVRAAVVAGLSSLEGPRW